MYCSLLSCCTFGNRLENKQRIACEVQLDWKCLHMSTFFGGGGGILTTKTGQSNLVFVVRSSLWVGLYTQVSVQQLRTYDLSLHSGYRPVITDTRQTHRQLAFDQLIWVAQPAEPNNYTWYITFEKQKNIESTMEFKQPRPNRRTTRDAIIDDKK